MKNRNLNPNLPLDPKVLEVNPEAIKVVRTAREEVAILKLRNKRLQEKVIELENGLTNLLKDIETDEAQTIHNQYFTDINPSEVESVIMNSIRVNNGDIVILPTGVSDSVEEVTLDSLVQKLAELTAEMNNYLVDNVSSDTNVTNAIIRDILQREAKDYPPFW